MKDDSISRHAARSFICDIYRKIGLTDDQMLTLCRGIKGLPPAQPERPKGKWIYGEHDIAMCDGYWCDQCGFFVPWDYKHKSIDFIKDYHWCPSCRADMRGEQNE